VAKRVLNSAFSSNFSTELRPQVVSGFFSNEIGKSLEAVYEK